MQTANIIRQSANYFAGALPSNGIRIGMTGVCMIDLPEGHKFYDDAMSVTAADDFEAAAEAFIDDQIGKGNVIF